jgi:imidazolonepropionase-like amidohydrolase
MIRPVGEAGNATMELAGILHKNGIPFVFQSGFEGYVPKTRVVHFEAGVAAANGLPVDAALRALTINAATFLGIQDRLGSLEAGKDADLALFNGDPLEYTTHTTAVMINGKWVSTEAR